MHTDYDTQAQNFLDATGTTISKEFRKRDLYFPRDKEPRNIRNITLKNKYGSYTFTFGDSIANTVVRPQGVTELEFKIFMERGAEGIKKYFTGLRGHTVAQKMKDIPPSVPSNYAILACLDIIDGSFEDFCGDFGYDTDSREAEKTYKACIEQSNNLRRLFDRAELEMLQEIR